MVDQKRRLRSGRSASGTVVESINCRTVRLPEFTSMQRLHRGFRFGFGLTVVLSQLRPEQDELLRVYVVGFLWFECRDV